MSASPTDTQVSGEEFIQDSLQAVRRLLGMQVAFVAEFCEGMRVFRYIDSPDDFRIIEPGTGNPLEESYCQRVVDGRLPELLHDATRNAEALSLPVTTALPVGAHLSVPIVFSSGEVYGTFCCFSTYADDSLSVRDLETMRLFAGLLGKILEQQRATLAVRNEIRRRVRAVLDGEQFRVLYQPIVSVAQNRPVGYEALTRFMLDPELPTDQWFSEAMAVGMQEELEITVIRKALERIGDLPDDVYLSLNISPESILRGALDHVFDGYPLERLMLEVTEHVSVGDYAQIAERLAPLRAKGLRLAVDDAGAGYASFRHILKLKPDVIKLDASIISGIETQTSSRALAAALVRFAEQTGSKVVAEGVETQAELDILRELDIRQVQGYLLGRPEAPPGAGRSGH